MTKQTEALKLALKQAFDLGQTYWSWADSEYQSHWKKADAAKERFNQLVEDTISKALAAQQTDWEAVAADQAMTIGLLKAVQPAQPLTVAWQVTEGGAYKSDPYWVAERVDGKGWNAHKDGENLLLADSLERCKAACELDAQKPAQQQEPVAKVVSTAPERIWLDLGFDPEVEDEVSFDDLFDATWSHDNATGSGIEYVRADLAPAQRKPLTDEQVARVLAQLPVPPTGDGSALHDWAMQAVRVLETNQ